MGVKLIVDDGVLGDDLFVPERAVFGGAFLGFKVDVDDTEPLGVALGPLEVVDQRPDVVAVNRDAGLDGAVDLGEVVFDVIEAARVPDLAVGGNGIGEAGTVLGYVDAFGHIVPMHAGEGLEEALGVDVPAHTGSLFTVGMVVDELGAVVLQFENGVVRRCDIAAVEVNPEKVDRGGDLFHIAVLDRAVQVGCLYTALVEGLVDHVGRIAASENGVEEHPVTVAVNEAVTRVVLVAIADRDGVVDVEDDSDLGIGYVGTDNRHGRAVREEKVVGGP